MEVTIKFDPNTMQQGPYPFTGSGPANQLISTLAPMLIGGGMGMANPMMAPHTPLGISPRLAEMARQQNVFRDAYMEQVAGNYRQRLVDQGVGLGLHRDMRVSAREFRSVAENLPLEKLSGWGPLRSLGGGDPMELARRAYDDRHLFVRGHGALNQEGEMVRDIDNLRGQMATEFHQALERKIRPAGVLQPDFDFTRGLSDTDVYDVARERVRRSGFAKTPDDAAEFLGSRPMAKNRMDELAEGVGDAVETVTKFMDVLGSTEMDEAFRALDRLHGRDWVTRDPADLQRIQDSFHNLAAFGELTMGAGSAPLMMGWSAQGQAMAARMGHVPGGSGARIWGEAHSRHTAGLMKSRGLTRDDMDTEYYRQTESEAAADTAMLAESPAARRGQVFAVLRDRGLIGDDSYQRYLAAIDSMDPYRVAAEERRLQNEAALAQPGLDAYAMADSQNAMIGVYAAMEHIDPSLSPIPGLRLMQGGENPIRMEYRDRDTQTRRVRRSVVGFGSEHLVSDPESELENYIAAVRATEGADNADIRAFRAFTETEQFQAMSPQQRLAMSKQFVASSDSGLSEFGADIRSRAREIEAVAQQQRVIDTRFGGDREKFTEEMTSYDALRSLAELDPRLKELVGAIDMKADPEERSRAIAEADRYARESPALRRGYRRARERIRPVYAPGADVQTTSDIEESRRAPGSAESAKRVRESREASPDEAEVTDAALRMSEYEKEESKPGAQDERHMGFGQRLMYHARKFLGGVGFDTVSDAAADTGTAAAEGSGAVRGEIAGSENRAMTVTVVGKLFDSRGQQVGTIGSG